MTHLILVVTVLVAVVCLGLITTVVVSRLAGVRRTARSQRIAAPARAQVLELVAGGPDEIAAAKASLLTLPAREWACASRWSSAS